MPGLRPTPTLESIWDYPSTPRVEPSSARIQVVFNGFLIADSDRGVRLTRCGRAPQYYFPAEDVRAEYLHRGGYQAEDESLGAAAFYSVQVGEDAEPNAAWTYQSPKPGFEALAGRVAFDAHKVDAAFVDGEPVHAAPRRGDGGWVTREILGTSEGYPKGWRRGTR